MKNFKKFALAVALASCFAAPASAAIMSLDDSKFGIGAITFDTTTKLEWLDLTLSTGRSYVEVTADLLLGGRYEGFRYASRAELNQLQTNFGFTVLNSYDWVAGNGIPAYNFIQLLGNTRPETNGSSNPFTDGFVFGGEVMVVGGVCSDGRCDGSANDAGHAFSRGLNPAYAGPDVGSFLVREAPGKVPEPASLALFGVALAAMGRFGHKIRNTAA